ncbi:hypothetical protein [Streptomyces sp. TP-A0874]|uniref:hypothetical protein n=1 Tax=Streptomyces sp. TP-A0874 TaxID=549819 RepID=UPI00147B9C07|nr:hypothetical protein [Streptomyces sp. TP-A0874]
MSGDSVMDMIAEMEKHYENSPERGLECDRWTSLLAAYIDSLTAVPGFDEGHAGGCG